VAILGTTYTGHFYDVEELDAAVEQLNKAKGWEINIHVDAASGGFVAPFLYPDLKCELLAVANTEMLALLVPTPVLQGRVAHLHPFPTLA
jgi:glutamate/tyrosine decarboxylase-like PLP-dependent enzyme